MSESTFHAVLLRVMDFFNDISSVIIKIPQEAEELARTKQNWELVCSLNSHMYYMTKEFR